MKQWQPHSWQQLNNKQLFSYPHYQHYQDTLLQLRSLPPLVSLSSINQLQHLLAKAALGEYFLIQGGDCAERFIDCHAESIQTRIKALLHCSLLLSQRLNKPIIKVGRIAGQYAKSRSAAREEKETMSLPSYFGDLINRPFYTHKDRAPNPKYLLQAYRCSNWTLSFLREHGKQHFADLYRPHRWELNFLEQHHDKQAFLKTIEAINEALATKSDDKNLKTTLQLPLFTSHEALHLAYEESLTQQDPLTGKWYNFGAHLPWIGMRTAKPDGAHIEYIRGIYNPVAVKIGPDMPADQLMELIECLNPHNEPGRLTLIHRLGAENVQEHLPKLIAAAQRTGKIVLWVCDPMHGNIKRNEKGEKVRYFDDISSELHASMRIHQENGSHLGGVHLEMTGENVYECIGGNTPAQHPARTPTVDPRLNYAQSLELCLNLQD
jgi:3-deoxy-7-phosphoheptulonate synthase